MIVEATKEQIAYVLERTQPIEKEGLDAVLWGGFDIESTAEMLAATDMRYCCLTEAGEPAVVGGMFFKTPAVVSCWMYGTVQGWREVLEEVTEATRAAMRALLKESARRIEVYSISTHKVAHRWYERRLGLKGPLELKDYGIHGETFYLYSLTRGDL